MILQSLVSYYEALAEKGEIAKPGWQNVGVSFALNISRDGELLNVLPLKTQVQRGKSTVDVPMDMTVPLQAKRQGFGAPSNYICDNVQYVLGLENGEVTVKSRNAFASFKSRNIELLGAVDNLNVKAVLMFLNKWEPNQALQHPALIPHLDELSAGGNCVFMIDGVFLQDLPIVVELWENFSQKCENEKTGVCLVTGRIAPIARTHSGIKGVDSNSPSPNGCTMVCMDKEAYESFGKKQAYNAPISEYAAFAYTTALNKLLSNKEHRLLLGDSTVVFWAEDAEPIYQDSFSLLTSPQEDDQQILQDVLTKLKAGAPIDKNVNLNMPFYILALAPNSARLSVRFFLRDSFGHFLDNICSHYDRLEIAKADYEKEYLTPKWMLKETVSPNSRDKAASPGMSGAVLRAILTNAPYPVSLYTNTMLRIRAERKVTRGKAAIIKAYFLSHPNNDSFKEVLTVALNEQTDYEPYVLGRIFSLLENIQEKARGATTVKDNFFNSACTTPAVAFPKLFKLENSHMKVLMRENRGSAINLERALSELMYKINICSDPTLHSFPKHLSLDEQGAFILGYYHQTQKRFEKKEDK